MPKYLLQASYAARGEEGVRAKGGTNRRDAVADTVRSIGGELECIYFEFGDHDALAIVDLPDNEGRRHVPDRKLHRGAEGDDNRAAHTRAGRRSVAARRQLPPTGALRTRVSAPGPLPAIGAFLPLDGMNAPIDREGDVLRYIALLPPKEQQMHHRHYSRHSRIGPRSSHGRSSHFHRWGRGGARARRGDIRAAVLALLEEKPMHGYEMITEVEDRTGGAWRPSATDLPHAPAARGRGPDRGHRGRGASAGSS